MRSVGEGTAKTRVNINIFLSQDVPEDGLSDAPDEISCNAENNMVNINDELVFEPL